MVSKRFEGKVVWITGGGSGLGRAMALRFASQGAAVAVSGRRVERIDEVASEIEQLGVRGLAVPCDVTDDDDVRAAVVSVTNGLGRLDVAVANAGFGVAGRIEDVPAEDWRRQFEVNVIGLTNTIRHAMPELRATRGRMVLMGSVAGMVVSPGMGPYHASKHAVRAIGQALAMEVAGSGVTCTTIHPGFIASEGGRVDNKGVFHEEWTDKRPRQLMWETDRAAKVMVGAIYARKREYVFTGHGKAAAFIGRHAPGVVHHVVTSLNVGYKRHEGS